MSQEFGQILAISRPVESCEHFRMSSFVSGNTIDTPSVNYHPRSDSTLLEGGPDVTMARKGCCLYFKIAWSTIGLLGGISICFTFFIDYENYHAASWGFGGGVMAAAVLQLHYLFLKDKLEDWHNQATLWKIIWFGFAMFVLSTGSFASYITLGILNHQTYTLEGFSYFPAATFTFYTMKWSVSLMWEARSYRNYLQVINPALLPAIPGHSYAIRT